MRQLFLVLTLLFASQTWAEAIRLSEPVESTADYEVFGAPLPDKADGQSLRSVIEQESELAGKEVRVSTRIAKVCQKKGCFFVATEGANTARITFADYSFFIPTDSGGKDVTLVGTFNRKLVTPEQAAHYKDDLGEKGEVGVQPTYEYAITATSVLIPRG